MRVLALITDAFGGCGGMAKFNRDLLTAVCSHLKCTECIAIPRSIPMPYNSLPFKLNYITKGTGSKNYYITQTLKCLLENPKLALIICGHINFLPLAFLAKIMLGVPLLLCMHGIEIWQRPERLMSKYLINKNNSIFKT